MLNVIYAKFSKSKLSDNLGSLKVQVFILATYMFWQGKLSESGWLMLAAGVLGLREYANVQSMKVFKPKTKGNVDDPDQQ